MKLLASVALAAACIIVGTRFISASAPVCIPGCDSCHVCMQLYSEPGHRPLPPACAPKQPKPLNCP